MISKDEDYVGSTVSVDAKIEIDPARHREVVEAVISTMTKRPPMLTDEELAKIHEHAERDAYLNHHGIHASDRGENVLRLLAEHAQLRAVADAARDLNLLVCFVTDAYPEHAEDCQCAAVGRLDVALDALTGHRIAGSKETEFTPEGYPRSTELATAAKVLLDERKDIVDEVEIYLDAKQTEK